MNCARKSHGVKLVTLSACDSGSPVVDQPIVVPCNAKEEAVKTKSFLSSFKPKDMISVEAATGSATFERTIEAVVGIVTAGIVYHPSALGA